MRGCIENMKAQLLVSAVIAATAAVLLGSASPAPKHNAASPSQAPQPGCDALPDGVSEIPGLRTAVAIRSPETSALRLQFADEPHGCREPETVQQGDCNDRWQFGFTLLPELQTPGVYDLSNFEVGYSEYIVQTTPGGGCGGGGCATTGTGAAGGAKGPDGTIEIFSVTDTCVTGRVLRLSQGSSNPPKPDFTGGFRSEVCARAE